MICTASTARAFAVMVRGRDVITALTGVVAKSRVRVKVLGNGELKARLEVAAHAFSKSAAEKIQAAGGKVQTISLAPKE